ncbi:MAG: BatD family protein [Bacteroidales bacterium]|nr:BatD family protein [Candidatus Cacconaster scatequi]
MKRIFASFVFFFISGVCAIAQTLTVDAPRVVSMDETFRVVFTADGKMADFDWPGTSDFSVVWGPQRGSMSSTNIVNGKRTSSHQETVTYLLQPVKEGVFTISGATAKVDKKECSSKGFTIEVVASQEEAATSAPQGGGSSSPDASAGTVQSTGTVSNGDIFLKLSLSKTSAVKGEPITATLKIYTRTDIAGFEDVKFPTFNGFWSKETASVNNLEFNRENVNGTIYNSALIRKYMLIPQQSGTLVIDPAEMVCQIRVRAASSAPRSIFDDFFDNYQTIRKRLTTPEIKVKVSELPAGAPASFGGGVGKYSISASLSKKDIKSNEAVSLIVKVTGNGNVSMLEAPKVDFPSDFEVYDLKSTENVSSNGTEGGKTFEYPFISRSHGDFVIPSIQYSYYDISKGGYVTVSTSEIPVKIEKGEEIEGGGVAVAGVNRQGVKNLKEDIRYIHLGDGNLKRSGHFFAGSLFYYGALLLVAVLYFVALWLLRFAEGRRADVVGSRNRKANKLARAKLRTAKDFLSKGLSGAYYEELHKALIGYVSDKLSISAAELSRERIGEGLAERGVSQESIAAFTELVDKCEFARYSPDNGAIQMQNEYNEAVRVISQLESEVKTNRKHNGKAAAASAVAALLLLALPASATGTGEIWNQANEAYAAGNWQQALDAYSEIEEAGYESADLCFNMGNAYFKMGDNAHAILYYEKALKLDPGHSDATNNLAVANQFTLDKIEAVPEFILASKVRNVGYIFSADGWAFLSLGLVALCALLLLVFKMAHIGRTRKTAFILAAVALLFAITSFIFSISLKNSAVEAECAIVVTPVSSVKSSPSNGGNAIFVLHEGTKVKLLDQVGEWTRIEIADGRQGWLSTSTLENI